MEELFNDLSEILKAYYFDAVALLPKVGLAIIVFFLFLAIAAWMKNLGKRVIDFRVDNPLLTDFLGRVIYILSIAFGIVIILNIIGLGGAAASIMAGAGISAFVIGFAFKDIGENFLAGILMAFKRPFEIGDVIETGSITGKVIGMSLRDTQLKTFDGKDIFIPNGMIMKNPIINRTIDGFLRYQFTVGLDYDDDLNEGVNIIEQVLLNTNGILQTEGRKPNVIIEELGTSTVNVTAYFWINTDDKRYSGVKVKADVMNKVVAALAQAGYYLPADIIELKNYQNKSLSTEQRQAILNEMN